MVIRAQFRGVNKAIKFLSSKESRIERAVKQGMAEVSRLMEKEVKASISGDKAEPRSVDTGEFLRSVAGKSAGEQAIISSDVPQSKFMEFGTSHIRPRRHFRNSLERNRTKIAKLLNAEVKRGTN